MKKLLLTTVLCAFTLGCFSCAKPAGSERDKNKDMRKKGSNKPSMIEKVVR